MPPLCWTPLLLYLILFFVPVSVCIFGEYETNRHSPSAVSGEWRRLEVRGEEEKKNIPLNIPSYFLRVSVCANQAFDSIRFRQHDFSLLSLGSGSDVCFLSHSGIVCYSVFGKGGKSLYSLLNFSFSYPLPAVHF